MRTNLPDRAYFLITGKKPDHITIPPPLPTWQARDWRGPDIAFQDNLASLLNETQRLVYKMGLQRSLTRPEQVRLRDLKVEDRYHRDDNHRVTVFCLGRASGKSMMARTLACALSHDGATALVAPTQRAMNDMDRNMTDAYGTNWLGAVRSIHQPLNGERFQYAVIDEIHYRSNLDSIYKCIPNVVVFTTPIDSRAVSLPRNIPWMGLSMNTSEVRPLDFSDDWPDWDWVPGCLSGIITTT